MEQCTDMRSRLSAKEFAHNVLWHIGGVRPTRHMFRTIDESRRCDELNRIENQIVWQQGDPLSADRGLRSGDVFDGVTGLG